MSCPDCVSGHIHTGTPTGKMTTIHGRKTYVAEPPNGASPKGVVVIISDAFGLPFINNQLLADNYARKGGYTVYLPDFMDGSPVPVWVIESVAAVTKPARGLGIYDWLITKPYHVACVLPQFLPFLIRHRPAVSWPKVQRFFDAVRCNEGANLGIGAAGFCWGGQHVARLAGDELTTTTKKPLVDCSFTAHPSNMPIPDSILNLKRPFSLALADHDFVVSAEGIETIKGACKKINVDTEVVVYEDSAHGFGVRADLETKNAKEKAERAEDQAIAWFQKYFPKV